MKKVIAFAAVIFCCSMTTVMAQGGGQQDPAARLAAQKERYKALGLNDVQTDSVIAINDDVRKTVMAGVNMREMADDVRAAKMKEMTDARNKRLEKALPADLAKKVIDAMAQQGQRGGGRPGGQ